MSDASKSAIEDKNGAKRLNDPDDTVMLEGKLRAAEKQYADSGKTDIKVEVYKLQPERLEVPQGDGTLRISTERGLWRFESARFSEQGPYEILATISIGNRTDWRSVTVIAYRKRLLTGGRSNETARLL